MLYAGCSRKSYSTKRSSQGPDGYSVLVMAIATITQSMAQRIREFSAKAGWSWRRTARPQAGPVVARLSADGRQGRQDGSVLAVEFRKQFDRAVRPARRFKPDVIPYRRRFRRDRLCVPGQRPAGIRKYVGRHARDETACRPIRWFRSIARLALCTIWFAPSRAHARKRRLRRTFTVLRGRPARHSRAIDRSESTRRGCRTRSASRVHDRSKTPRATARRRRR